MRFVFIDLLQEHITLFPAQGCSHPEVLRPRAGYAAKQDYSRGQCPILVSDATAPAAACCRR